MKCSKCHSVLDRVVDTRPQVDFSVRRRREHFTCGHRWNTIETYVKEVKNEKKRKINKLQKGASNTT